MECNDNVPFLHIVFWFFAGYFIGGELLLGQIVFPFVRWWWSR